MQSRYERVMMISKVDPSLMSIEKLGTGERNHEFPGSEEERRSSLSAQPLN
jgi:hypothetical protein